MAGRAVDTHSPSAASAAPSPGISPGSSGCLDLRCGFVPPPSSVDPWGVADGSGAPPFRGESAGGVGGGGLGTASMQSPASGDISQYVALMETFVAANGEGLEGLAASKGKILRAVGRSDIMQVRRGGPGWLALHMRTMGKLL